MPNPHPNDKPSDHLAGLSPRQVHQLVHRFAEPGSVVRINPQADVSRNRLPLVWLVRNLLDRLAEKEIPLTQKGNLPGQLVKSWYADGLLPDDAIENGITKLTGEDDYAPAQVAKHLPLLLGWTKKRHNKLSLTVRGNKARKLADHLFFEDIFCCHLRKFNLGWSDGYNESHTLQQSFGFLAYLLLTFGAENRLSSFYCDAMQRAFPRLETEFPGDQLHRAFTIRLLERFLAYHGLVERGDADNYYGKPYPVRPTPAFYELFRLTPSPPPNAVEGDDSFERQLRTALFDAEMGSQSYTSEDLPLEMLEGFQEQIRLFEEREAAGDAVPLRILLGDLPIVPPRDIPDEATFRREIARVTEALAERGIWLPPEEADELSDRAYYAYLHDQLLDYPVVPPPDGSTRIISKSDVLLVQFDPIEALTERFLLSMFRLGDPFPADILADTMRLNDRVVPRERGLQHIVNWRKRWKEIVGLAFDVIDGPELDTPSDQQTIQFFLLGYQAINAGSGERETFEGGGVVECILEREEWRITGAQFPGFVL
ncbi:hypothetical protein [Lewinella sp. IMCC34191]|uniref:hypothetical protein n=1 Tax=Lewinella sp. IMCC34191 TaxID=2259172 RepID=UPI000E222898|nr:hypothetical protein [Lewinella sp. IMCC34191]